jgi:hypothetical protein
VVDGLQELRRQIEGKGRAEATLARTKENLVLRLNSEGDLVRADVATCL